MLINIQTYLLALDVFALTALFMAASATMGRTQARRNRILLSLFGLVLVRSAALIAFLRFPDYFVLLLGSFEITSLFCIVWALVKSSAFYNRIWLIYIRLFPVVVALAALAQLAFNISWQPVAIFVALSGIPLIFSRRNKARWAHIISPAVLAFVALLSWLGLPTVGQFAALMGYAALVYAIFSEVVIRVRTRQQTVESLGAETRRAYRERSRFIELSSALSVTHNPFEALNEAAKTIAKITQTDCVAVITFSDTKPGVGYVSAMFTRDNSIHYTSRDNTTFNTSRASVILDIQEDQKHLILSHYEHLEQVKELYDIWGEDRLGPTLLQPLLLNKRGVGILVIANPVSKKELPTIDIRLAQSIAPQLASMVVYQSQYQSLELQSEALAAKLQLAQGELETFSNIVEAMNDGVVVSNVEGRIELANSSAQNILNKTAEALLNKPINSIYGDITSNKSIEKLASEFSRSNKPLPTYFEREGLAVQGKLIPLRNSRQEWMGILVLLRDVTKEIKADKTKQLFLETISRELRSPLTTVLSYADLMISGATGKLDIQQDQFLKVIRGGINKVIELVNYATRIADHETNDIKLDIQTVNIEDILQLASATAQPIITSKHLQFCANIPPDLPLIQADPVRLNQVFDYVLSDTCRHSPDGGYVLLKAWIQADRLNGQSQFADYLIVSVSANEMGESGESQEQIFDPGKATPNKYDIDEMTDSRNLGLKVTQNFVEAHRGRMWVEADGRNGNAYHIALPY